MKKYFIIFLVVVAFLANPSSSKAEVQWDGAQIVKGQTGKMTFTKDVKVYKKNANGTYSSMTVKHNNYFRVYNIEKYDNKTFYWMSSGYRVQATDLVVFKKVPLNIRASFYDNPGYILLTENDTTAWIEIDGEVYSVPKKVLATIRPNESPIITTSFLPNDTLQQLVYQNYETPNIVYKKTTNNRFEAPALKFIDYYETEINFHYEMDGNKYAFEKPVTEGSKVTRTGHGRKQEGFVRAINYTITTPAGTFNNVVETSLNELFAGLWFHQ